jgi:protein-S-isoprenylcysteine O-methyltransferase Ste14
VGRELRREPRHDSDYPRFYRRAAFLMNNDALSFVVLSLSTQGTLHAPRLLLGIVGAALIVLGIGVKLWAREAVGTANYYWRDFFGQPPPPRVLGGPYRYLKSPMYTVGNLHLWGIALAAASLPGLVAAAFAHAAILVFNHVVEQPQVRIMYGKGGT